MKTKLHTSRELVFVTNKIAIEVMEALQNSLGKSIWHLSDTNKYKLYRLWIWKQRYCVSLEYILSILVPYFSKGVQKRTGKISKGLGVSIPVLTGDVAETILKDAISKDFPDGDHLSLYREAEKERITNILNGPIEFRTKVRKSLQFKSLDAEFAAYKNSVTKKIKSANKIENKFKKIPFRTNPWH